MTMPNRALSLYAPWCVAILRLGKDIENRNWRSCAFRGDFWIHASLFGAARGMADMMDEWESVKGIAREAGASFDGCPTKLGELMAMRGHIVGRARVVDAMNESGSPWFCGPLGLVLADPVPLAVPVPAKGALGFWRVPAPVLEQLKGAA
jgi:hypothetical protein